MRVLFVILAMTLACRAEAADKKRIAVFDFSLIDTSPAPPTSTETARLHRLTQQLDSELAARYTVVPAPLPSGEISIQGCNGCELDIARKLGVAQIAYGWVQKVSDLILNINLVIEDAHTGKVLRADSVDIRGNTDLSWSRGLHFLLDDRLFRQ
jgi:hypothetical protein